MFEIDIGRMKSLEVSKGLGRKLEYSQKAWNFGIVFAGAMYFSSSPLHQL